MESTEAQWLEEAQNGDDYAFSQLVESYQRQVFNLCYRMLGNAADAEDAAQETFYRAYKSIKRYDPKRKFSTWLLTIASNYCIDQHRRKKLPTFSYDSLPAPNISDGTTSLEQQVLIGETEEEITMLLNTLSPKDKSATILRYWYDYSYEDIAETLSLSVSAVKSRLHRSRKSMAEEWLKFQNKLEQNTERTHYESTTV